MASSTESGGRAGTVSTGFSTRLTRYASSRNATASQPVVRLQQPAVDHDLTIMRPK
jgi:hypothetical protein